MLTHCGLVRTILTHSGLVTTILTNDSWGTKPLSSKVFFGLHLRASSQDVHMKLICNITCIMKLHFLPELLQCLTWTLLKIHICKTWIEIMDFDPDVRWTNKIFEIYRGTDEHCGVSGRIDIINSTLGKALGGAAGGYTTGPKELIELLRNRSRPYLFSNSMPPPVVACASKVGNCLTHWSLGYWHIEAETRWTTFRRRHFQMHFLEWRYMSFD